MKYYRRTGRARLRPVGTPSRGKRIFQLSVIVAFFFLFFLQASQAVFESGMVGIKGLVGPKMESKFVSGFEESGGVASGKLQRAVDMGGRSVFLEPCVQDGTVVTLEEGGFFEGIVFPAGFLEGQSSGICGSSGLSGDRFDEGSAKRIVVVEGPELPLLLFPFLGWTYRVAAPSPLKDRTQKFSAVLAPVCEEQGPVCLASLVFEVPSSGVVDNPPLGDLSPPSSLSVCAPGTALRSRTYFPEGTYVDTFNFDPTFLVGSIPSNCSDYVAKLSSTETETIPFGLLAVMPSHRYSLSYIFSAPSPFHSVDEGSPVMPEEASGLDFVVPYTIHCDDFSQTPLCADNLYFRIEERALPVCPIQRVGNGIANTVIEVGPGSYIMGRNLTALSGLQCPSEEGDKIIPYITNTNLSVLNAPDSPSLFPGALTVFSGGTMFRYDASEEEIDVIARIRLSCGVEGMSAEEGEKAEGEINSAWTSFTSSLPSCELTLVFLVSGDRSSNNTGPPPSNDDGFETNSNESTTNPSFPSDDKGVNGEKNDNNGVAGGSGGSGESKRWIFDASFEVPLGNRLYGQLRVPENLNLSYEVKEKVNACPAVRFTQAVITSALTSTNLSVTDVLTDASKGEENSYFAEVRDEREEVTAFLADPLLWLSSLSPPSSFSLFSLLDDANISSPFLPIQTNSGAFFLNLLGEFSYQSPVFHTAANFTANHSSNTTQEPKISPADENSIAPRIVQPFIDVIGVHLWCVTGDYFGPIRVFFTNFVPIIDVDDHSEESEDGGEKDKSGKTEDPLHPPFSPVDQCSNVYYYYTPVGIPLSSSLQGINGETPCAIGRYFILTQIPTLGKLDLDLSGDFIYTPSSEVKETAVEAKFHMHCANRLLCDGVLYIVVSNAFSDNETLPDAGQQSDANASNTSSHPPSSTGLFSSLISCEGTCTTNPTWITLPTHHFWDADIEGSPLSSLFSSLSPTASPVDEPKGAEIWMIPAASIPTSEDIRGVEEDEYDGFHIRWKDEALVISTRTAIGNMGARFPTFDVLTNFSFLSSSRSSDLGYSTSFNGSCLALQGKEGKGDDVWVWDQLQANYGSGTVGTLYDKGLSWYQTFGGKHDHCNIFQTYESACQYAPLLTPSAASIVSLSSSMTSSSSSSSASMLPGVWSVAIHHCFATWTVSVPYSRITQVQRDGQLFPSSSPSTTSTSMSTPSSTSISNDHNMNADNNRTAKSNISSSTPSFHTKKEVFQFTAPLTLEGFLLTEAIQPRSWLTSQEGIEVDVDVSRVRIGLRQYVGVVNTALERPFVVDTEWFEFVVEEQSQSTPLSSASATIPDSDGWNGKESGASTAEVALPGDMGFGINLLVYPSVTEDNSIGDFMQKHRIVGFKWLQQQWQAPGNEECPTCTGVKLRCYAGDDFSTGSYEGDSFPSGECPPGVGRVYLYKGPSMTEKEVRQKCSSSDYPKVSVASSNVSGSWDNLYRRGFSVPKDCGNHYQNLTLRGVLPGSGQLSPEQKRALHLNGMLLLQVLTSDGFRYNIRLHISMYISMLYTVRIKRQDASGAMEVLLHSQQDTINAGSTSNITDTTSTPSTTVPPTTSRKPTSNFDPNAKEVAEHENTPIETSSPTEQPGGSHSSSSSNNQGSHPIGKKKEDLEASLMALRMAAFRNITGELRVCRSSRYFPVLDPFGSSTPLDPLPVPQDKGKSTGALCVEDASRTYGPQDWALLVVNMDGIPTHLELHIDNIYVDYRRAGRPFSSIDAQEEVARIYLRFVDSITHKSLETPAPSVVPFLSSSFTSQMSSKTAGSASSSPPFQRYWWKYTAPFLAYRAVGEDAVLTSDVSSSVSNSSFSSPLSFFLASSMSAEMADALDTNRSQFAFLFIPGAVGWNGEAEVVVEATLLPSRLFYSGAPPPSDSSMLSNNKLQFREVLHITPDLTDTSRYGYSESGNEKRRYWSTHTKNASNADKRDFFGLVVITGVSVLLILSVVLFFLTDSRKPLPQWVPRGEVLRSTVKLFLPRALKKRSKAMHRITTMSGSGGEPHLVEIPIIKVTHKNMYEAMNSGKY